MRQRGRRASVLVAAASLVLGATPSSASEPTRESDPPTTKSEWYGGKMLALDGAALGLLAGAGMAPTSKPTVITFAALAGTTYAIGAPLVHWSEGQRERAATSLALRVGLPLVLGAMGGAFSDHGSGLGGTFRDLWGWTMFSLGVITAVVVDDVVLARRDVTIDHPAAPQEQSIAFRFGKHHTAANVFSVRLSP